MTQANQLWAIQLVGTPEVVNHLGSWLMGIGVADIVSQLVVGSYRTVLVLALGLS